ncbi:MAG: hypothetical protein Q8O03_06225 [Nanoarchaeota archaeon]|nr:hypothetical protein [Nanoarchaeota archaeon]
MKVPKTFTPEKNLDEKTRRMAEGFSNIKQLIEKNIGEYWKEREYCPDPLITEYKHMKSATECANIQYACYWGKEVSITIFKLNKSAKKCMEEVSKELDKGIYEYSKYKTCLIKNEIAIILKTLSDTDGLEIFEKHYREKFGFC